MKKILGLVLAGLAVASFASAASFTAAQLAALGFTEAQIAILLPMLNSTGETTTGGSGTTTTGDYVHPGVTQDFTQYIYFGSRGAEVERLQTALNAGGFNAGTVDGAYGPMTKASVQAFQSANGLGVDGKVGPATRAELNRKAAATTGDDNNSGVTGDKLVVSGLASDDMVIGDGQTATFTKLTLEAGDEDVKVNDITVKFEGTADRDTIDEVKLLDSAMAEIDTDSLDSDDEAKVDADLTVKAGDSVVLYIAAKTAGFTSSTNGLDVSLKVTDIDTDGADVEGTPIMGASHELHEGLTVDEFTSNIEQEETSNVQVGEEKVKVATVNVENGSDDDNQEIVKSVKLTRTGTAGDHDIDNVKIIANGKTYKATQDNDEYTFDFGDGIKLDEESDDVDLTVYADVVDGSGEDFGFDITDMVVVDTNNNILTDDGTGDVSYNPDTLSIELSQVDINDTDDVNDQDIAAGTDDSKLGSFEAEVNGEDVEGDLEVDFEVNHAGAGTDGNDIDLEHLALYTKDGDKVSDFEHTNFADGDNDTDTVTFDNIAFDAGNDPVDYVIKGDISKDAPTDTTYQVTEIRYVSIEDADGEDIDDVNETTDLATTTVEGSAIEVSVEEPEDTDINSDTDDVAVAQVKLNANDSGDDVKVSKIKLDLSIGGTGTGTVADLRNCELFDDSDSVSEKEDGDDTITFDVDIDVTKDTEKTLELRCDIGDEFVNDDQILVAGNTDYFEADGEDTDTQLDGDVTGDNGTTGAKITDGSVSFEISSDDVNDDKVVRDNADDVVLGQYEFEAKDADLTIDDITTTFTSNVHDALDSDNIDVYINGNKEGSEDLTNTGPSDVEFTNLGVTVNANQKVTVEFRADADTANTVTIDKVELTTEELSSTATEDTDGPVVTIVEALPVVTQVDVHSNNLETEDDAVLFAYKVKAEGGDVDFTSTKLTSVFTNANVANAEVKVYDNADMSGTAKADIATTQTELEAGHVYHISLTIDENDTYYLFVVADVTTTDSTRSIRTQMNDDATGAVFGGGLTVDKLIDGDMKSLLKKD